MISISEDVLKNNPVLWAQWEYVHDFNYWQDRSKHGAGLIQQIARFVLEHGKAAQAAGKEQQ